MIKMKSKAVTCFSAAVLLIVAVFLLGVAVANPVISPMIGISSPQNNHVYPSNSVWLDFTALYSSGYNFTSFSYSLDGQNPKTTDGHTLLTDLPPGSHTLIIYGNATIGDYKHDDMLVDEVYFSTIYSTPWVMFTLVISAFIGLTMLILFVNRRQAARWLKSKKTFVFWIGLSCFLVSAVAIFVPSAWQVINDYLFPHYSHGALTVMPLPIFMAGLTFMGLGLILMAVGTKKQTAGVLPKD